MFRLKKVSNLLTVPIRTTIRKMSSADSSPWQEEKGNKITELDKKLNVFGDFEIYIYQIKFSVLFIELFQRGCQNYLWRNEEKIITVDRRNFRN